jgi:FeS assembly SUF system regulator
MIRLSRLTDYGIVLMSHVAAFPERGHTAAEIAGRVRLPVPTVSKLLRVLARAGLLTSQRGVKGGYSLARQPEEISVASIISALEGPISLTLCTVDTRNDCAYEPRCPARAPWQRINSAVRQALDNIRLSEMTLPVALPPRRLRPHAAPPRQFSGTA